MMCRAAPVATAYTRLQQVAFRHRRFPIEEFVFGGFGNDRVFGDGGADGIGGGPGDDVVFGGTDGDTVSGESGNDRLFGGPGSDDALGSRGCSAALGMTSWPVGRVATGSMADPGTT